MAEQVPFCKLSSEAACEALARAGLRLAPEQLHLELRDERWMVRLPGDRLAWFAASQEGQRQMAREHRVLRLLEERCTFRAPRILFQEGDSFDVRAMVPGVCDPSRTYSEVLRSPELAKRTGAAVGAILAEQHANVQAGDVAGWLPLRPGWPQRTAWIRDRLIRVTTDLKLIAGAEAILSTYESLLIPETDCVLVHTDLGFHNLSFDPETREVRGVFDYEGAAWADRHHDFRYLVFDAERFEVLDAALSVYESALNRQIDRRRVFLYNAACALTYLADRVGTGPGERPCGRTLAEDVRWSRQAIERALK